MNSGPLGAGGCNRPAKNSMIQKTGKSKSYTRPLSIVFRLRCPGSKSSDLLKRLFLLLETRKSFFHMFNPCVKPIIILLFLLSACRPEEYISGFRSNILKPKSSALYLAFICEEEWKPNIRCLLLE